MPLNIIGAGFGRTGTNSLRLALNQLGVGPCYHMLEVSGQEGHRQYWHDAIFKGKRDWDWLFQDFNCGVDWPITHYWEELIDYYPDAKVILTVRDPEKWFKSFFDTIYYAIKVPLRKDATESDKIHRQMLRKMIFEDTFAGKPRDKDIAMQAFTDRIAAVKASVAPERLLVYEITEGWQPLCEFLGLPIPDAPMPRTNSTQEFREQEPDIQAKKHDD